MDQTKKPITIKKYANRRLYNTETSTYVTLDDLAAMVRAERDFVVFDAKTSEDLTHSVLTQIILEQESRGQNLLPVNFLRQLIRFYGDSMGRLVPSYLNMSMETLSREQERFRKQMTDTWGNAAGTVAGPFASVPFGAAPFGTAALEAMQEQTRQNMALFEKAMSLWSPFTPPVARPGNGAASIGASAAGQNGGAVSVPNGQGPMASNGHADVFGNTDAALHGAQPMAALPAPVENADLAVMREQLAAMQRQLDRLEGSER